jgi:large subunit ribosomal protein L6
MSRIGKKPVLVPKGVKVALNGKDLKVEGPVGKLSLALPVEIKVRIEGDTVHVDRAADDRRHRSFHGLYRTLVSNAVFGVSTGFKRELEINGVGYRAAVQGQVLNLSMGYSHPVEFKLPAGVKAEVDKQTRIVLTGADKQVLGETAAKIRSVRPPEPYKGKGIKYAEETVRRKAGKTAAK